MRSLSSSLRSHNLSHFGCSQSDQVTSSLLSISRRFISVPRRRSRALYFSLKLNGAIVGSYGCNSQHHVFRVRACGDDSFDFTSFDDWDDNEDDWDDNGAGYIISSSDGEDSDREYSLNPVSDLELPSVTETRSEALTVSAYRLSSLGRTRRRHRIRYGVFINVGLITFLTLLLLFVDCCAWKIVRLPLAPFYLTHPFCVSAVLVSIAGYITVPILNNLKIRQIMKIGGPIAHSRKRRTPTMGGLFFIPIGVAVAKVIAGFSSTEVSAAAVATLGFAAIGLVDDVLTLAKGYSSGLSAWLRIFLEVAVGTCFSLWLNAKSISSPYGMYSFLKMLVPLPAPLGLLFLGKFYLFLSSFCFVSMGNGVTLTDTLDGLAGGIAALAFVGMSIAVLPICADLAIFGASMAGACVGFLLHNRHRASIYMGDTGSLALGGALASMAACSGMFFPLFISSGIFILEASSVLIQVGYYEMTKYLEGRGRGFLKMAPFHHHLELRGLKEPAIVGIAYAISSILSLSAGYVGLISA